MKKKISWIELVVVIVLVFFVVKGYYYWNEPLLSEKIITEVIGEKEKNILADVVEVKFYFEEDPNQLFKEFTLTSSNDYKMKEEDKTVIPVEMIIKSTSFSIEKEVLLKTQQKKFFKLTNRDLNIPIKKYRFILENYPLKVAVGEKVFIIAKLVSGDPSNIYKPTKNVDINFTVFSGEEILLETGCTTDETGLCIFNFIPKDTGEVTVKGEYYKEGFTYSNICKFKVRE